MPRLQMTRMTRTSRTLGYCLILFMAVACLVSCAANTAGHALGSASTPSVSVPPVASPAPLRAHVTVVFEPDLTGSYPYSYALAATRHFADLLDAAARPGESGVTAYIDPITSASFDPMQAMVVTVPPVPALPAPPRFVPPPATTGNPFADSEAHQRAAQANAQARRAYRAQVSRITLQFARVRAQVRQQTDALRRWRPRIDTVATSIWGGLARASMWFAGQPGQKWLIVASDWQNNTNVDRVPGLSLAGVHIRAEYFYCLHPASCQAQQDFWSQVFHRAGAVDWEFIDPVRSLTLAPFFS